MAASGDEEKQNLGEETTSLLKLEQRIENQKASFEALQIEVKSLLAHKLRKEEIGNQKASFEALHIELTSLRAHVDNTNNHVLRPTSSSAIKQDSDTDKDLLYTLPSDTFTLMMVYNPLTPAWNIGIFSFILQMLLLILILISQINEGDGSTPFNVPFKVENEVRIGQFAVIIVCVLSQDDVLTSLQGICALWKCGCTAFQDLSSSGQDDLSTTSGQDDLSANRQDDLSASGQDDLSTCGQDVFAEHYDLSIQAAAATEAKNWHHREFYALHILLPNLLKFAQGVFVLLVSLVIIVQGDDLIDLLKDSTALFFVSTIDNVIFFCATAGYFGHKVGRQAQVTTEKVIVDVKKWSFIVRSFVVIIIGSFMISALSTVTYGQVSGNYFILQYPNCNVTDNGTAISKMMNGVCDGGELNTLGCAFDGGDCINNNLAFPRCNVKDPEVLLGNGVCNGGAYNTPECKYDDGDCIIAIYTDCHSFDNITLFGDGVCHLEFNTASCGYDKGDCDLFNSYPNCDIPDPDQLGDGTCNTTSPYNSTVCGYDGGDCVDDVVEGRCKNQFPDPNGIIELLGDGECNTRTNNQACGWDGKDCLEFNANYPDCVVTDDGTAISKMNNGICDGGELNTLGCAFDGGDCIDHNLAFPGCNVKDPEVLLGNDICNNVGAYNTIECGYDGGDCEEFNAKYPNCNIPDPDQLGDGTCNTTSPYNSIICGYDGGDCVDDMNERRCSGIKSANITELEDGNCNAVNNNQACGWDGKDCLEFNAKYPACGAKYNSTVDPERVGDGKCDNFGGYNSLACGNDGSDCSNFNLQYPECEGDNPDVIGDGKCDPEFNNVECGFDGYDCDPDYLDCSTATTISSALALCDDLRSRYPNCALANKNANRYRNFDCDLEFNSTECGFDGGDCNVVPKYPDCNVAYPGWIGDGRCDGGDYNTIECGFDGEDCNSFNAMYPNCNVEDPYRTGDGICNDGAYDTTECGFDGGDCVVVSNYPGCRTNNPGWIGNGYCNDRAHNTLECGYDGGDCNSFNAEYPNCTVNYPGEIGNGVCDGGPWNNAECGFDGGDCDSFNAEYPNCNAKSPSAIGNGFCNGGDYEMGEIIFSDYNTIECGFDGGDCVVPNYPDCRVDRPDLIGNGFCDRRAYNTIECGFEAGDCDEFNAKYPNCNVDDLGWIGDDKCNGGDYNTAECGFDGGDCAYLDCSTASNNALCDYLRSKYPNCGLANGNAYKIGNFYCDQELEFNTEECGFDGGDCDVPSSAPSSLPSISPTQWPTSTPSSSPSLLPTSIPSQAPTLKPSPTPSISLQPTSVPSSAPSSFFSDEVFEQISGTIKLNEPGDRFGETISINESGTIVAVGARQFPDNKGSVTVYEFVNGVWEQKGDIIVGLATQSIYGPALDMSQDGLSIVIGEYEYDTTHQDTGAVRVYSYNETNSTWDIIGSTIEGEQGEEFENSKFGYSVAISDDGTIVAIGAPDQNNGAGVVYVFRLNDAGLWEALGDALTSAGCAFFLPNFGFSVSLSGDGKILACGVPLGSADSSFVQNGVVELFQLELPDMNSSWSPYGLIDYEGDLQNDFSGQARFGDTVSLSRDGSRIAIGAVTDTVEGKSKSGSVFVYEYNLSSNIFQLVGNPEDPMNGKLIGTPDEEQLFGESIAISRDGAYVVVGAQLASFSGSVSIYRYNGMFWDPAETVNGNPFETFGKSVAITVQDLGNGENLVKVAGGGTNEGGISGIGVARVYQWQGTPPQ